MQRGYLDAAVFQVLRKTVQNARQNVSRLHKAWQKDLKLIRKSSQDCQELMKLLLQAEAELKELQSWDCNI